MKFVFAVLALFISGNALATVKDIQLYRALDRQAVLESPFVKDIPSGVEYLVDLESYDEKGDARFAVIAGDRRIELEVRHVLVRGRSGYGEIKRVVEPVR